MVALAVEKAKPGEWIVGRGWHQEKWIVDAAAERRGLSDARVARQGVAEQSRHPHARERPRVVREREGAGAVGITKTTANPNGGEILKDKNGKPTGLLRETASRLVRRGAGEPAPTPEEAEARDAADSRAGRSGSRSRKASRAFRTRARRFEVDQSRQAHDRRGPHARAALDDGARRTIRRRSPPIASSATATTCSPCARSRSPPTARSARAARGCSSRTPTSPTAPALAHDRRSTPMRGSGADRARRRLSGVHSRDRRPRESRSAERLRRHVQEEQQERQGSALAHRARAAPQRRRHSALRPARRHRRDAGRALHVGRAVGRAAPRRQARRRRRLRLAEAHEVRRGRRRTAPTRRSRTSIRSRATTPRSRARRRTARSSTAISG